MNQEKVNIRKANLKDIDNIIVFIKEHYYIPNHVFTRNRDIFDDWHVHGNDVWFVIGEGMETKALYGILGYTLYSENITPDVSLAIFQTIKSSDPSLGIHLVLFMRELYPNCIMCSSGMVPHIKSLYEFLGYKTGKLKHYYRLNDLKQYKIAQINKKEILVVKDEEYYLRQFKTIQEIHYYFKTEFFEESTPRKDYSYISRKYFFNIGYNYLVFGIFNPENECIGLLCGREVQYNNSKCFKIVDYIGNARTLSHCSKAISDLVINNRYEYIDFYEIGIEDDIMHQAGFSLNDGVDNIIPQYFEPFVLKNIDIFYFTSNEEKFCGYRSDGGQERPNCL